MEEKKPTLTQQAKGFWQGLNKTLRISVAAVLAVCMALIIYLVATAGRVEYEVLQTGLSPKDAADAAAILGDLGIPYTVEGVNSVTIRVPKGTRAQVLLQMQQEGYPASGEDLYSYYTENAMGMGSTDQDKRVLEQFSLEQRLSFLIRQMEKVKDANVVVTLQQDSQFALSGSNRPAQASVILTLESGAVLTEEEAKAVRAMVLTGVPGLLEENVTITDTNMHIYSAPGGTESGGMYAAEQITLKQQHQQLIQEQVHNFLDPVFGTGNVVVSASVELDFDKKSTQTVTYAPPGDADNMGIIVSLQQAAERAGVADMAEGVAGFDANGAAPFYPEDMTGDTAPVYNYSQQLNAEVNEVRQQIEEAQGKVAGLSVSIMIDADEALDGELENIRALVANGLGVAPEYISIMRRSFLMNEEYDKLVAEQAEAQEAQAQAEAQDGRRALIMAVGLALLALLVILMAFGLAARKRRRAYEAQLAQLEEAREQEARQAVEQATAQDKIGGPDDSISASRLKDIQGLAQEKPEVVAQLLRNWLTDDYR